ncbi:spectrin-like nuclear envelope [Schistosoma japonicum]|uniref:Spectrin-like nuclear envelope n=1 Tax=Schistosoma japonicum TaxID=6182 RepID=A0A4Z2CYA0_SCHJA|nr:spectrin-like nuclear envelope [Schistosoma japonicum]
MSIDLQSDCQIVTNQPIKTVDIIEPNCNHIKQSHQTLMNTINQDINTIQTKSTYLNRLIQSNKDLDEWIQELIQLLGINHDNDGRIEQIQLKLDIGKAYIHSIHEWIEQFKQINYNHNSMIIDLLNQQIKLVENKNQNFNEFLIQINYNIEYLINCLNELNNELINKQSVLVIIINENLIHDKLIQMNNLLKEINQYQQNIEQIITNLKCIKIKLKELNDYLKKIKQWTNEIIEQFYRIRDGKSPIRVSPYPSRNESIKSGYWKTTYPIDTPLLSNTIISSTTIKPITLRQSNEFRSITPSITNQLLQQLRNKMDTINVFIEEITKSATLTANEMNTLLDELDQNMSKLQIDYTMITNEIDQIHHHIEQIIMNVIDYKQDIEILINQLNQYDDVLCNSKNWLHNNLIQIKRISQQSISGITDLSMNQSIKDKDEQVVDIFCPLDEIIQNYQVFQSELMSHKSELTQLNSLCESIQERSNDPGVKNALDQLLMQYHSLIKSCEDVLSKLQQVFMENREFQVLCNSVRNFLDNIITELKGINKSDQNSNLSEADLNKITNIREKLRSSQSKLLELSDRADRICRASSTAALTMNQMFIMHTSQLVDNTDSVNTPMYVVHNQQLTTNQHGIDNLQTETVGSKAKRQLNEFRKEFSEISQQITEYQEKVNHLVNEQKTLSELYNDLRIWIDKTETKLTIIESGRMVNQTDVNEQNIKPLMRGSNKFNENDWNVYIQQVKALNKELNEYSQKFEQFCDIMPNTTTKTNGQTSKFNQLIGRFTEMKGKIKQCTNWISAIQQNYATFRESAQTTERWMSSINFRLMSAGNNSINNNNNQITNLTTYQDSTVQIDQLIREIDKEGRNLLENTHHLVHLLIHAITKDQISKTNRICENVNCPYREIPIDHSVVDNWKYLVNNSNEEKLLDKIALDALERNKEIETTYINIHSNALSIKSRLDDQSNRFKSYIDSLNSTATFILNDLQSWWKRLSVISQSSAAMAAISGASTANQYISSSDPVISHQYNVTGFTSYPNKSFINYQIDRLKQLTDEKLPAKAISLEDVGHQLAMTLAMQSKLITMKRELSTLAYKCGMSSMDIDYSVQENDKNSDNKGSSSDQTLVKLLAKHVQNAIDIENKKLEYHIEQLRELRIKWENYVKERDIFNRWLSERQTACHHLLELRSRSTQPEDEESRALEDFLHSLKDKEHQLSELLNMHQELIQYNSHTTDPLLDRLNTEYKNLLNQTSSRINRVEKEKHEKKIIDESHSEYRGKVPILPEKAEALVRSSNKTLNHTKLLNELAKSVSQLKNEVITSEVDAQRSTLILKRHIKMLAANQHYHD